MRTLLTVTLVALSLGACGTWPPHGSGGAAEYEPIRDDNSRDRAQLINAQKELALVRDLDGAHHLPAALDVATLQWKRAARALNGGFSQAAKADLARLETMLADIRSRLRGKLTLAAERLAANESEGRP